MKRAAVCLLAICAFAIWENGGRSGSKVQAAPAAALRISSPAFKAGGKIPAKFTCQGENVSPALEWTVPPPGTESLALIADDPDAPGKTWVHWVVYDLPASLRRLPEAVPKGPEIAGGGRQGENDFGDLGYGGPCPPPGKAHHYHFKLYAVSQSLQLKHGAQKEDVLAAMRGRVLCEVELIGVFER